MWEYLVLSNLSYLHNQSLHKDTYSQKNTVQVQSYTLVTSVWGHVGIFILFSTHIVKITVSGHVGIFILFSTHIVKITV